MPPLIDFPYFSEDSGYSVYGRSVTLGYDHKF